MNVPAIPSDEVIAFLMEREILAALEALSEEKRQYLMTYAGYLIHPRTGGTDGAERRQGEKITSARFRSLLTNASAVEVELIYRQARVLLAARKEKSGEG